MSGSENVLGADKANLLAVDRNETPSNALEEVLDFCSQAEQHSLETCSKISAAGAAVLEFSEAIGIKIPAVVDSAWFPKN